MVGSGKHPSVTEDLAPKIYEWLQGQHPFRSVVDVGSGLGFFVQHSLKRGVAAVGIEPDPFLRAPGTHYNAKAQEVYEDMAPGHFDLCTAFEVAEHVPREEQIDFWVACTGMADRVFASIHVEGEEHEFHRTIMPAEEWQAFFDDIGMRARQVPDFQSVVPWACSTYWTVEEAE